MIKVASKVPRKSINRSYSKQFHTTTIGVYEWVQSLLHSRRAMLQKLYRQTIATIIQEWKSIGTSQWCCRIFVQCQKECWCSSQSKKQVSNNSAILSNQNWSANGKQHTLMAICNAMLVSNSIGDVFALLRNDRRGSNQNVLFILAQLLRRLVNLALLVQWNLFSVIWMQCNVRGGNPCRPCKAIGKLQCRL